MRYSPLFTDATVFLHFATGEYNRRQQEQYANCREAILHHFCAKLGCAPKILGYQKHSGGWIAIAMEYMSSAKPIRRLQRAWSAVPVGDDGKEGHKLKLFHAKGWVHGDLRDANILCDGEKLILVDFDFAASGKPDEVFYSCESPSRALCSALRSHHSLLPV